MDGEMEKKNIKIYLLEKRKKERKKKQKITKGNL